MPYRFRRVIPRDLFNESKLLKCLGRLSLLLHDGMADRWPLKLRHMQPSRGFVIDQDPNSGCLFCTNLTLTLAGREVKVFSVYNSKEPYPLLFQPWSDDDSEGAVFNDDGDFSAEFVEWLDRQ